MKKLLFIGLFLIFLCNFANTQIIGPVVGVTGTIINSQSKEPLSVEINIYDVNNKFINKVRSNSADGYYYIPSLEPGKTYFIELEKDGFFTEKYKIDVINSSTYEEISRDFLVRPKQENVTLRLPVPPYELHKSKLRYGAAFLLEDITNTLKNNPKVEFKIICYPDNNKDKNDNLDLTEKRAESLKDFFVINGINPERIKTEGSGKIDPENPLPEKKAAKGKRYIGNTYIKIISVD